MMVLIADDEPLHRALLARAVRQAGHDVLRVANGADALQVLERHTVDVVVMDVMMPLMTGLEATVQIRKLPGRRAKTPIVGVSSSPAMNACLAAGMNAFVPKPIDLPALLAIIEGITQLRGHCA